MLDVVALNNLFTLHSNLLAEFNELANNLQKSSSFVRSYFVVSVEVTVPSVPVDSVLSINFRHLFGLPNFLL